MLIVDFLYIFLISLFLAYLVSDRKTLPLVFLAFLASIFLHEFAHKAVASYFGYESVIQADLSFSALLMTAILFILFGILIPPPIYTKIMAIRVDNGLAFYAITSILKDNAFQVMMMALAGPLVNFVLAIISFYILKNKLYDTPFEEKLFKILFSFNVFVFVINILPIIPGNDGSVVFTALKVLLE